MLKKLLALLIVAMLVAPATVLAKNERGFSGQSQTQVYSEQDADANEDIGQSEADNAGNNAAARIKHREKKEKSKEFKEKGIKEAEDTNNDSDTAENKAWGKEKANEHKKIKEIKENKRINASAEDSESANGGTHRGKGIAKAMSKIMRNIERKIANGTISAVDALKTVVNKFASWLGLGPVYTDIGNNTGGGTETTGTAETSGTVETSGTIETSSTITESSTAGF
ncbi:MAG: hypothetical protein K6T91_03100 [Firmicutes bacterium]|nr:hypothetical protein [Bacillota bacterium]